MHSSNIAPSSSYSAQDLRLDFNNTSLIATKDDFKAMISGLEDPVGNQIFDEIWKALIASNRHLTSNLAPHFNTSPLKIEKEAVKATIGGLGDPVRDQAFDGIWESLVEKDHHGGNKGNQPNINGVSKKRKADSANAGPHSDIESVSKKQKSASEVHDSTVASREDDALLLRGAKDCVHRVARNLKGKGSTSNKSNTNKTGNLHDIPLLTHCPVPTTNPTISPTPASHTPPPPTSKSRTYLPPLPLPNLTPAFTSLKRLNIALTPYKYPYFTHAEILRDDTLYAPLSVLNPQPIAFFGMEEEKRLRKLFPAFES